MRHVQALFFRWITMAVTTRQQRQQRSNVALQLISSGVPPTDTASQLTVKWGCSRRTSLCDIEIVQSELANALDSAELQQMVGWLAKQYQQNLSMASVQRLVGTTGTCSHRRSSWLASLLSIDQQKTSPIQASVVCHRDSLAQTEPTDDQMPSLNPSTETKSPHMLQSWNVKFQSQPGDWTSVRRPARSERCSYESRRTFKNRL